MIIASNRLLAPNMQCRGEKMSKKHRDNEVRIQTFASLLHFERGAKQQKEHTLQHNKMFGYLFRQIDSSVYKMGNALRAWPARLCKAPWKSVCQLSQNVSWVDKRNTENEFEGNYGIDGRERKQQKAEVLCGKYVTYKEEQEGRQGGEDEGKKSSKAWNKTTRNHLEHRRSYTQ